MLSDAATPLNAVDDETRPAVVDLLGALAYGEFSAFTRLVDDARSAPTLADGAALSRMAVAEFGHFELLHRHLADLGTDPDLAMAPFVGAIDDFHDSTAPSNWLESLVKAFVGDGIATDFYRQVAGAIAPPTGDLIREVLADTGHAAFAVDRITAAIAAEPVLAGRLALWARRLVGEALAQAQRVVADRDSLPVMLVGIGGLGALSDIFDTVVAAHSDRMAALGLSS